MPTKKSSKKGTFTLAPILLSQPVPETDGFSNLVENRTADVTGEPPPVVETPAKDAPASAVPMIDPLAALEERAAAAAPPRKRAAKQPVAPDRPVPDAAQTTINPAKTADAPRKAQPAEFRLSVSDLLRILEAESLDDVYELSDVLRASSLKLYATLVRVADERGRARIKNYDLMDKAGIKGIATLYKQERWLSSLRLVEKKAKPGPHDGSSYLVFGLETLPLPEEIRRKFDDFMQSQA